MSYYDDRFHPSEGNDLEEVPEKKEPEPMISSSSNPSKNKNGKDKDKSKFKNISSDDVVLQSMTGLKKIKEMDKHYHVYEKIIVVGSSDKFIKKLHRIEYYSSGGEGTRIRDAQTGNYTNHLVGSKDEDLYFKIRMSGKSDDRIGVTVFYDSPEHYERHHHEKLSEGIKESWLKKRLAYGKKP